MNQYILSVLETVQKNHGHEVEFVQSVTEVLGSLEKVIASNAKYQKNRILERMVIPERAIMFQIPWIDDKGDVQVNYGYRVQFNSAIGPYKGGMRFHPSVNLGILKFLGFEQTFKNSLTTLPMGGGKGGSNFDPKGKSDREVQAFCQSLMRELYRHIGPSVDVPAGDIGVGAREIGYMYGQYRKIVNSYDSVLTGKGLNWGGSLVRPEATGYGNTYFATEMLATQGSSFDGRRVCISGSGNVAQFTAQKVTQLGGKVVTLSDSSGTIVDEEGINAEKLAFIMDLKNVKRGRISEYTTFNKSAKFVAGARPWGLTECSVAMPSATQNELNLDDAKALIKAGCIAVSEGANMPTTIEATEYLLANGCLFAPGKAANAGGVATSGLEMSQNAMRLSWSREEVDAKLQSIMKNIHSAARNAATEFGEPNNYVMGANIAGFRKVADAMIDQGV